MQLKQPSLLESNNIRTERHMETTKRKHKNKTSLDIKKQSKKLHL